MSGLLDVLAPVAAVGTGVAAGVFVAFSTFVMTGLGRLPATGGLAAMRAINRAAVTPPFMALLFGTALACAGLVAAAVADLDRGGAPALLAGAAVYLVGVIGVTIVANVPRNEALERLRPDDPRASDRWVAYHGSWTAWNHVRSVAGIAAAALMVAGLMAGA